MNLNNVIKEISDKYGPLSNACCEELLAQVEILELDKKQVFVKEGEVKPDLYFIVAGGIKGCYVRDEKEVVDIVAVENEFIGSFESFFFGRPSPQYFQTFEKTILAGISRKNMDALEGSFTEITLLLDKIISSYLISYQLKINSLQFEAGKERYENLSMNRPDLLDRLALKDIASYLGLTVETLSRLRKKYKEGYAGD